MHAAGGIPFDGLTEEWRIVGNMHVDDRLSDALNKREAVTISDVQWAPIDGSAPLAPAPGLKAVDPYDLIIVLAGEATLPPLTDAERTAHKVHKVAYDVALEVPPFRVIGTVYLHPGLGAGAAARPGDRDVRAGRGRHGFPERPADRARDGRGARQPLLPARHRAGRPADRRAAPEAAGAPMGGISWQDRSR